MNKYLFRKEKVLELFGKIEKKLIDNKKNLEKGFKLDKDEWDTVIEFDKFINLIKSIREKEYLPVFSKEKIVDGIGKICLVSQGNPYLNFNFILSCLYTNNKVKVVLTDKLLASNKVIIECVKKVIEEEKLDEDTVDYLELVSKDKIISLQDEFDLLYYFGNKEEYLNFTKRLHIDSKFENFGEMYVYVDSKDFKEYLMDIDKFCFINEIKVKYFNEDLDNVSKDINYKNNINKISVIFTKDINKAYEFIKKIKTENVYVNINPCEYIKFETNLNNLVYSKNIIIKN